MANESKLKDATLLQHSTPQHGGGGKNGVIVTPFITNYQQHVLVQMVVY